ncbi:ATPase inhibitor mai-2, mitochondrial-like [Panulirus ornatus]|uniref:ATPase inhibitor mai-2, mitochondrial-like n=1 Tax=Panulirus ornatus TaxID=150431 RepID=UPI003A8BFCEE
MAMSSKTLLRLRSPIAVYVRSMTKGDPGSGAGEGGGTGGAIRDAGGSFGKREMAQEEQYFRKLQQEQLEKLRAGLKQEVKFHKEQIKAHEEALKRHTERLRSLKED